MELKSPTNEPVQVALLSGHCIVVGPAGREVPQMYLKEAFKCGCLPMSVDPDEVADVKPQPPSASQKDIIKQSVKKMLDDGCQLTGAGLPNLKELAKYTGFAVSKEDLGLVWNEIEAEAKE